MLGLLRAYWQGSTIFSRVGGDKVKITNLMGNVYKGSIGKSITASSWKGRNYLKKWFKPVNPNSLLQQKVREGMSQANTVWQGFNALQKRAFYWFQRYRKTNISPFNSYVGLYVSTYYATDAAPTAPPTTGPHFQDSISSADLDGVKCIIRKAGQATDYLLEYSVAEGTIPSTVPSQDENFDLFSTKDGYYPYSALDQTAAELAVTHDMIAII